MIILKGILILLIMFIVPLMLRDIITYWAKVKEPAKFDSLVFQYIIGTVTMWVAFEIVAVPLIFIESFMMLVCIWCAVIATLVICDIVTLLALINKSTATSKYCFNFNN